MKICVTSNGPTMDASVDPRFGRCQYFVFVDSETMEYEAMPNPSIGASSGAGIQAAQTVADKGASVVITGQVGPNAIQTLGATDISIVTGASGTVSDAIEQYKSGRLQAAPAAPGAPAPGMPAPGMPATGMPASGMPGAGMGRGMGRGGGRGGGRGMGGGMGRGMGMGLGAPVAPAPPVPPLPAQTIDEEIQALESQIKDIKAKLEELKK
ncbi:MAG: dinitrogenase iron-molybdenum cofactor biosynthesis protein [ANME-2 cluster archaeon]|jgi:predicted Fe-Mo cluster-binding NifX family protein|nr:dinitrogenase iron-molybdenum cofactor biosynthesis protein [ANME-2 cluster archaeon]